MAEHTRFVGLDVHKRTIAVATVAGTSGTFDGTIANTPDALRRYARGVSSHSSEPSADTST